MKNGRKRPIEEGEYPVYGGNGIMGYSNQYNAEDTIIVGRVGAYCGNVLLSKNKCWVSDNAISVVAKNQVHTDFLYYLMLTLDLHNQHIGAVQPLMTQDIIGRFEVKIPSLSTQLHIADILKSLNDKIEVNRKINSNLDCSTSISPDMSLGRMVSRVFCNLSISFLCSPIDLNRGLIVFWNLLIRS